MNNVIISKSELFCKVKNIISLILDKDFPHYWSDEYNCYQPGELSSVNNFNEQFINDNFKCSKISQNNKNNKSKTFEELAWFRERCCSGLVNNDDIIFAAKQICSKNQWLFIERSDGKHISVEANAKGTERYCKKQNGKILDFCNEIGAQKLDCAFLTLTCDPSKYENLADMWESYKEKEVVPVLENLRKNYGVQYVYCMESTAKMRPHIHILLFCPKGLFPELEELPNESVLRKGKLFDYVKRTCYSPITLIKTVKGENKSHYLTKYIGKGCTSSVFKILDKKGKISKEDYKLLYEFVFLTAFRKRKCSMTRKGNYHKKGVSSAESQVCVFGEENKRWEELSVAEQRAHLKSLCTNSLSFVRNKIYSMSYFNYKETFGAYPERSNDVSDEFADTFIKKSRLIFDDENFYTLFMDFVLCPEKSPLNIKFYRDGENGVYDLFTDGYNLDDDADFMLCCKSLLLYYYENCLNEKYSLKEVMSGFVGLTRYRKTKEDAYGKREGICSDNIREMYYSEEEIEEIRRGKVEVCSIPSEVEENYEEIMWKEIEDKENIILNDKDDEDDENCLDLFRSSEYSYY